jgi:hypothetical protein
MTIIDPNLQHRKAKKEEDILTPGLDILKPGLGVLTLYGRN